MSARAEPRTTRDIDLAIAVADDREAEALIASLRDAGYAAVAVVEQTALARLSTVRLRRPLAGKLDPVVDLLFCSSGIEGEAVADAETLEVFRGVRAPVAGISALLAMKVLARDDRQRPQDWDDLRALLERAGPTEIERARELLRTIEARGASRGRLLLEAFERCVAGELG